MRKKKTIVVAGALGLVGRAVVEYCEGLPEVEVIGLSRRAPDFASRAQFISVDLTDRADCARKLAGIGTVTHIVFAALQQASSVAAEVGPNLAMLRNVMEILGRGSDLQHVMLLQGGKSYGAHLGPYLTPAKEDDPRHMPPNFYYDQQDYLVELQQAARWAWTIIRPTVIYGYAGGNSMNLTLVIGIFAAISKELGVPLRFPGTEIAYRTLFQAVDADLVARAILWAGDHDVARNQAYNITNGDLFRWSRMWPHIADLFGMQHAEPQRIPLAEFMEEKELLWKKMQKKYALKPILYKDLANWKFGERALNREWDNIRDTTKLRDHGFDGYDDTFKMFARHFEYLRRNAIIPP